MMEECFKLTPYEYLKAYYDGTYTKENNGALKGVAIITKGQYIYYSNIGINDLIHYDIAMNLEAAIHPDKPSFEFTDGLPSHAYILLDPKVAVISFPENKEVSSFQLNGIMNFIHEVSRYNQEVEKEKRIAIEIEGWNDIKFSTMYDEKELDERILSAIQAYQKEPLEKEQERIIGKTPDEITVGEKSHSK